MFTYFAHQLDPSITWKDLDWIQTISPLPIVLKGILQADDAVRAVEAGTKAIIASNHGRRQLDGAISSLNALPEVVDAVAGSADVIVDGEIRRGTDVLKALALGAKAVLLGRHVLWGLAVAGEEGVSYVLQLYFNCSVMK